MSGYKLTSWTAAGASSATLSAGGSTVSTTYSTVLGNTVTYKVSSIASGYTFDGWYNASGTQLSTSTTYTSGSYTSTPPEIYAHFTKAVVPTIGTPTATSITTGGATLGAKVTENGGSAVTSYGVYVGTSANPTSGGYTTSGAPTTGTAFSQAVTGLSAGTLYHYRGFAVNVAGTSYTADSTFTTKPTAPTVTLAAGSPQTTQIKVTVATGVNGEATTHTFGYSTSSPAMPSTSITPGTAKNISSLTPGTLYYVTVRATANSQTADTTKSWATRAAAPTISDVTFDATSVTFKVNKNGNGDATEYVYGVNTSASSHPGDSALTDCTTVVNNGTTITKTGLTTGTTYYIHVRAKAGSLDGQWVVSEAFTPTAAAREPTVNTPTAADIAPTMPLSWRPPRK